MKKLLTLSFAFMASVTAIADPIDPQKAESIAQEYLLTGLKANIVTRAERNPAKAKRLKANVASCSPYYVYSRGEGKGFVIVSGDDCLPEVLGYTEQGDFDPDNMPIALREMLECYARAVEDAQVDGTNVRYDEAKAKQYAATKRTNIAPFVSSHWHQSTPYNDRCPRLTANGNKAATGCVATAAAQILYYWRKDLPSTLQSTTPTYGYGDAPVTESLPKGTPLKWEMMLDQYGSEPAEYKEAVADLVFATGAATWLTYGSSTSGNIEKIPATFNGFFGMNGGWVAYRNSYSQEAWTQLIYDELVKGRPVMYTGVHPNNGGHAVFVHGYQASTDKFYFNFGWGAGNGYDGYYTTTETDGMNGFCGYQSALIDAYPKKWNLNASIKAPEHVYTNIDNHFKVTVENHSTLPYTGIYLFASTTKAKPTNLKDARSSYAEKTIPVGSSQTLSLTAKPNSAKTWYITITDDHLNILDQIPVETENPEARLTANAIKVNGLLEKESIAGNEYTIVAGSKALVYATISNTTTAAFGGSAKLDIYTSEDEGQTFSFLKTVSKSNTVIEAQNKAVVEFSVTGLDEGALCQAIVNDTWGSTTSKTSVDASQLKPVYFKITGSADLTATMVEDELKFQGTWDASTFMTLVGRTANKTAINYDLTEVTGVSEVPDTEYPNANALIYAPNQATGTNVVRADGSCSVLHLVPMATFRPRADFHAQTATIDLGETYQNWNLITVPFDCAVPDGMQARRIDSHKTTTSGISSGAVNVTTMEGGYTYLLTTAIKDQLCAAQENVLVVATPKVNPDTAIIGTYTTASVPVGGKLITLNSEGKPNFTKVKDGDEAGALMGYFYDEKMTGTDFRAYASVTTDPIYMDMADAIRQMLATYEANKDIVSADANAEMLDSITSAEHRFSAMDFESNSQIKAYIKLLNAFCEEYTTMLGNIRDAEVDMTSLITNPSFDQSNTSAKGWTVNGKVSIRQNSNLTYATYGPKTASANYLSAEAGTQVTQILSNLKPGKYRLSAWLGAQEDDTTITLMAGEETASVSTHPFGKHYLTQAVIAEVYVGEEGELTIGVKGDGIFYADDVQLTYLGMGDYIETSILEIASDNASARTTNAIYTLSGQRVSQITRPGIYIVNGKKVMRK